MTLLEFLRSFLDILSLTKFEKFTIDGAIHDFSFAGWLGYMTGVFFNSEAAAAAAAAASAASAASPHPDHLCHYHHGHNGPTMINHNNNVYGNRNMTLDAASLGLVSI